MTLSLPAGHLSPTDVSSYLMCPQRYYRSRVKGFVSPPEVSLRIGIKTHEAVLDGDLHGRITTGTNLASAELLELYLDSLRNDEQLYLSTDLEERGGAGKILDAEAAMFPRLLLAGLDKWRREVPATAVEVSFAVDLGGVPVEGRIDVVEAHAVTDLKRRPMNRRGAKQKAYTAKDAALSLQLVPYAVAVGKSRAGFVSLCDAPRTPEVAPVEAEVAPEAIERVTVMYQDVATRISAGLFPPCPPDSWVCSARFCGYWKADARDHVTGQDTSCPHGQKAQGATAIGGDDE